MKQTAIELIAQERAEQIEKHGRTVEWDWQSNKANQMVSAAISLIENKLLHESSITHISRICPFRWDGVIWLNMCRKPYRERLIIAGALIAAEIDRLDYQEKIKKPMPDITLCLNNACPLAKDCFRHKAEPNEYWQSYAAFKPDEQGNCKAYEPIKNKDNDIPKAN